MRRLTHGTIDGIDRANGLARWMGLDGDPSSFSYGWAMTPAKGAGAEGAAAEGAAAEGGARPHCNFWSGYANTHGRLYCEDDSCAARAPLAPTRPHRRARRGSRWALADALTGRRYLLVMPQLMGSSPGGMLLGGELVAAAATKAFLSVWAAPGEEAAAPAVELKVTAVSGDAVVATARLL